MKPIRFVEWPCRTRARYSARLKWKTHTFWLRGFFFLQTISIFFFFFNTTCNMGRRCYWNVSSGCEILMERREYDNYSQLEGILTLRNDETTTRCTATTGILFPCAADRSWCTRLPSDISPRPVRQDKSAVANRRARHPTCKIAPVFVVLFFHKFFVKANGNESRPGLIFESFSTDP